MDSDRVVVLVVEDEFFIGQMIEKALEEGGYDVVMALNGSKGWALLEENAHDLSALVTDIRAGEGPNGWDIAGHARHLKPEMAVTYVTGDGASDWAAEGVPDSLLLQKLFTASQIVTAVSSLLNASNLRARRLSMRKAATSSVAIRHWPPRNTAQMAHQPRVKGGPL